MEDDVDKLIAERKRTHGPFGEVAALSQATKKIWQAHPGWQRLTDVQRESLEHNLNKTARAICGNSNHTDHWVDQIGYLKRILEELNAPAKG